MAVMAVRALGYGALAEKSGEIGAPPFTDVAESAAYISIASRIRLINGNGNGLFLPDNTAKREEVTTMLLHLFEKHTSKTEWLHGFYAVSSYSQHRLIADLDAVTFGWSAMIADSGAARLLTSAELGNGWVIPDGYEIVTAFAEEHGTKSHLGVYMSAESGDLAELLSRADSRAQAVNAIITEVTRSYDKIGKSPYSGVTVDFEGLRGADIRTNYTAFITELSGELKSRGLTLYVTVQPATSDGVYFDGYDYRAIGRLADRVILMAHDYNPRSLEGFVGTQWQNNTPLTPLDKVFYSLSAITDPKSGVEDAGKLAIAISYANIGWHITSDGKVASAEAVHISPETLQKRMAQSDTVLGWSDIYRNPYMIYTTEDGGQIFLWYEDNRSIAEKLQLSHLFGINGVSFWRLGIIPTDGIVR
jgi:hypothetical protein